MYKKEDRPKERHNRNNELGMKIENGMKERKRDREEM